MAAGGNGSFGTTKGHTLQNQANGCVGFVLEISGKGFRLFIVVVQVFDCLR